LLRVCGAGWVATSIVPVPAAHGDYVEWLNERASLVNVSPPASDVAVG
jgi:hypothetical protein